MNAENTKYMFKKYPAIFQDRKKPMSQSLVCFGFEFRDGWFKLMDALCDTLTMLKKAGGTQVVATQMKEKYAGLRFYHGYRSKTNRKPSKLTQALDMAAEALIDQAENRSYQTCEICGEHGDTHVLHGHYYAMCSKHATIHKLSDMLGSRQSPGFGAMSTDTTIKSLVRKLAKAGKTYVDTGDRQKDSGRFLAALKYEQSNLDLLLKVSDADLPLARVWLAAYAHDLNGDELQLLGVPGDLAGGVDSLDNSLARFNAPHTDNDSVYRMLPAMVQIKLDTAILRRDENRKRVEKANAGKA